MTNVETMKPSPAMNTPRPILAALLALGAALAALLLAPCFLLAQGALTPPGAPAPLFKTLDQLDAKLEKRTPISSAPFIITNSGSYYVTANLNVTNGVAITIATNGVALDLNGFTISSTASPAAGTGILLTSSRRNVIIANGFVQGGVTNNGSGVYSGVGFSNGISSSGVLPANVRVSGVTVMGCLTYGIRLVAGNATVAESCTVLSVGSVGITASTVRGSTAGDCGGNGIEANQVSDSRGESFSGIGISAQTVLNSYGSSVSGTGLLGSVVQNSQGFSNSGTALQAYNAAMNCYAQSFTGVGLSAATAAFCVGTRNPGGTALQATIANGCIGLGGTNNIVNRYNMP
jgi:hypothetical protein